MLEKVNVSAFHSERHRRIYRAMLDLFERGDPIAPIPVDEELKRRGDSEMVGGLVYLAELMDYFVTWANIDWYIRIVNEHAQLRQLIHVGTQIVQLGYDPGEASVPEVCDEAGRLVMEATARSLLSDGGLRRMKGDLYAVFERMEKMQAEGGAANGVTGVPSGLETVDAETGGFQKGNLVLVAARPSMGKTAFVTGIAIHAALRARTPTAIFSLEMTRMELIQRILCAESLVNLAKVVRGWHLEDADYVRMQQVSAELNDAPLWIDDSGSGMSVLQVRAKARRLKAENPELGLIVVDYIQLMGGAGENRTQEVSAISRGLKALAKELDLPIIALSQLSRSPEHRTEHRPQLSDLRESGSLEQDADIVMFLFRPEYYLKPEDAREKKVDGQADLIIAKQRNGPIGTVELYFRKECARFECSTVGRWGA